jgi:hypothetical protein
MHAQTHASALTCTYGTAGSLGPHPTPLPTHTCMRAPCFATPNGDPLHHPHPHPATPRPCRVAAPSIFLDVPLVFAPESMVTDGGLPFVFRKARGMRLGVLPRHGPAASVQWFAAEGGMVFHTVNAWEEPGALRCGCVVSRCPCVAMRGGGCAHFIGGRRHGRGWGARGSLSGPWAGPGRDGCVVGKLVWRGGGAGWMGV